MSRIGLSLRSTRIYLYRHPRTQLLLEATIAAVTVYTSALLTSDIKRVQETGGLTKIGLHLVVVVTSVTIVAFLFNLIKSTPDMELTSRAAVLAAARSQLDDCLSSELSRLETMVSSPATSPTIADPQTNLANLVKALYRCIDSQYAASDLPGERINFEVTFMSRDYEDGGVTIMAWASREGRAPKSLAQRPTRPAIYDSTVTASLYREADSQLPRPRMIENTADSTDYTELYAGQKSRIKSTIIYPVLSASNDLLGTLVLHCDREKFFEHREERFWYQLIEIFALRVAIEKLRMDRLRETP